MNWRELAKKAAEKGKQAYETTKEAIGNTQAAEKIGEALEKTGLKKVFNQAKDKLPIEAATKQWQAVSGALDKLGVNDAAAQVQKAFAGLEAKDVAGILTDTYKNMSAEEALKLGAAIVAPGGIPVYAVVKIVEYRQKLEKEKEGAANKKDEPKPPAPPAA